MSSSWLTKLIQKDKQVKNSLVFSKNYKNQYLKKKNLKFTQNKIPNNKIKPIVKHSSNNKKALKPENNRNLNNHKENNLSNKNEIINGGHILQKISHYNSNDYDKSDVQTNNNETYNKKTYNDNHKSTMIGGKNSKENNLKKFINPNKNAHKFNSDTFNKKYYFSTEKLATKINLNELNNNLKYLKFNIYRANSCKKRRKNKCTKINFIKCPTTNFIIENMNLNTIPIASIKNNFKLLKKDTRDQFSMEKNKYRKFNGLKEEDNILLNYFPSMKTKNNTLTINSNQIEFSVIKNKNNSKPKERENKIKEIIIINPLKEKKEIKNKDNKIKYIKTNEDTNDKKEMNLVEKTNNNSKQFNKFKEKFKKKLEQDADKKNDKYKISVKIKNLALGLENQMKKNEEKNQEKNNTEEKLKVNDIELDCEKIKEKIPIIYKKKKQTKVIFNDK